MASTDLVMPQLDGLTIDEKKDTDVQSAATAAPNGYTIPSYSSQLFPSTNATVDGSSNPAKTPFLQPTATSKVPSAPPLSPEQATKYESLLSTAKKWTDIPDTASPKSTKSPLTDSERLWLTRDCFLRYLRASQWSIPTATTRLLSTLTWRREWGVETHTADYISPENETGKQVITGFDYQGRPCLYLNPHKQNTKGKEKQMHHLVFMLERAIDLMPPGQETLALLVNFRETRQGQNASLGQGRQTISILQSHYPERLGRSLVQEVPWLIWGFFKAISPFIDPATKEKLKFDEDLRKLVPPEQLIKSYGGDVNFEYEHEKYWPAFITLANTRRAEMIKRWEGAGKNVGESEAYLKGEDAIGDGHV
ncbi:MAG: hypothetical protein Q9217_002051 [Psora testacea]